MTGIPHPARASKLHHTFSDVTSLDWELFVTRFHRGVVGAGLSVAAVARPVLAQTAADSLVVTRHRIAVAGRALQYTARTGLLPIRDNATGDVHAYVFFVSYRLDQPA